MRTSDLFVLIKCAVNIVDARYKCQVSSAVFIVFGHSYQPLKAINCPAHIDAHRNDQVTTMPRGISFSLVRFTNDRAHKSMYC